MQPHLYAKEIIPYHEAGHTVMARLFGINVDYIRLDWNDEGTYNGVTVWDRGRPLAFRTWDPNIPYNKLGIRQGEKSNEDEALVLAAGKAAERIWYHQRSMDETQASYGSGRDNDERQLEEELAPPSDLKHLIIVDLPKENKKSRRKQYTY